MLDSQHAALNGAGEHHRLADLAAQHEHGNHSLLLLLAPTGAARDDAAHSPAATCRVSGAAGGDAPARVACRSTSVSPAQPTRSRSLSPIPALAALARVGPRVLLLRVIAAVAAIATIAAVAGVVLTTVATAEDLALAGRAAPGRTPSLRTLHALATPAAAGAGRHELALRVRSRHVQPSSATEAKGRRRHAWAGSHWHVRPHHRLQLLHLQLIPAPGLDRNATAHHPLQAGDDLFELFGAVVAALAP